MQYIFLVFPVEIVIAVTISIRSKMKDSSIAYMRLPIGNSRRAVTIRFSIYALMILVVVLNVIGLLYITKAAGGGLVPGTIGPFGVQ